ncbi:MAG TPA: SCO family protein [Pyrinomonadaceae bacterium]|nr:SCO family protein [Pyrinomonadaceae bacterium]
MKRTPLSRLDSLFKTFAVLLAAAALSACAGGRANEKRYEFKGKVVGVDRAKGTVSVEHEEIKGYMAAMTMDFPLRDADALKVVEVGDRIQATLVVTDDAYWLESPAITKAPKPTQQGAAPGLAPGGSASTSGPPEAEDINAPAGPTEPQPGAEVPDVKLVNQDGRPVGTRQFRGRALVVTFIYTRCPLPDYCPLMSTNFAQLNAVLLNDVGLSKRAHLLSVTLDPEFDKPEVLKSYGATYAGGKFDNWDFATGDPAEVRRLAEFFGLMYKAENGQVIHSLRTGILTPDGKLFKLYRGNEWKPDEILNDLKSMQPAA